MTIAMLVLALPQRTLPGVRWFIAFMGGVTVWTLGYAAEILLPGLGTKLLTAKIQYLGITTVPAAWLAFTLEYSGSKGVAPRTVVALFAFPAVTVAVAWTTELHGLLYRSTALTAGDAYQVLAIERGIWFWLVIAFAYGCLLVATGILVRTILLRPPLFRGQAALLLFAGVTPWLGNIVYISGLIPSNLDLTVFGFAVSGLIAGWAILRWRLLSIGPIGRDTIVERLDEAVAVIDFEGRLVDVNPAAVRLFEKEARDLVGHDARSALGRLELELDPDETRRRTVESANGERRYDMQVSPLRDDRERLRGWTVVLFDVTERAARAAALERARAVAEQTARAQRLFLTNMNHELRTPLNGVLGTLDVLLASGLAPDQRQFAEMAQKAGQELLHLVDRILDFTTLETGRIELAHERFDLATTVREAVERFRSSAEEKGLKLIFTTDPDIPVWAMGDAERISQITSILSGNALKFTEEGEVRVALELESLGSGEATVRMTVSDTGVGISADRLEAIFEPLTQADDSLTRKHQGAGLGLTIADRIVMALGGDLGVRSEVGVGTSFSFAIRLALPVAS